jgi:hypothetical protein
MDVLGMKKLVYSIAIWYNVMAIWRFGGSLVYFTPFWYIK